MAEVRGGGWRWRWSEADKLCVYGHIITAVRYVCWLGHNGCRDEAAAVRARGFTACHLRLQDGGGGEWHGR